jgi:hypothetical protein
MKTKKNKLTNFFKKVFLVFGITLLFFGCDSEEIIDTTIEEQFHGELIEKVSFEQIKNDVLFSKAIKDFKLDELNGQFHSKSSNSSDLKIDLNSINKIEKEHATTYTFLVEDTNKKLPPFAFKNLVLEITSEKTQGYFITYYPTNEYIQNKINNVETDFTANIAVSEMKEDITQLLNQITSSKSRTSQRSNCTKYLVIETVCASGQHWPGDSCSLSGSNRAQTYSIPVLDDGCDSGGGGGGGGGSPIGIGSGQNISIPGGGGSSGSSNPPSVNSGSTFPNVPSGIGDMNSDNIENLLSYNPSILENKTNYFNYLKHVSSYCNASGQLDLGSLLYNYGANSSLSNQELVVVSSKAKEILSILAKNNFSDVDQYSLADQKTIAQNSLFIGILPNLKEFGIDFPQTAEEWEEFGEFLITVLKELVPELIPGVGEIIAFKNAISAFNSGNYSDGSTELAFAIVGIFPVGKAIKAVSKIAKGVKIVVKLSKAFKNAKKVRNLISSDYDKALTAFNQIGTAGSQGVRQITNSSKAHGKTFFEQLTKNIPKETIQGSNGSIIKATFPDGSKIQFRDWATSSEGYGTKATIQFVGGNYTNLIKKLKFNE